MAASVKYLRGLLILIVAVLLLAGTASASTSGSGNVRPDISVAGKPVKPTPVAPTQSAPAAPTSAGGILGSPDTTEALGGTDASCHHLNGASQTVVRDCNASGLAESAYPPGNFGTDTHVNTGITDPGNDLASILQEVFGWIWEAMASVLTWIILGLGLAFGFDLFRSDKHGKIAHGLAHAEHVFTGPLLHVFLIVGAIVGMVYWFGQRSEGRAVTHWFAMLAMMGFVLIVIANPVGVFGWADNAANGIASGALSAFSGQGGGPSDGFANAAPGIYRTTMEEPWCAMEFGSVAWCMAKIDPAMAAARRSVLAHLPEALGNQGTTQLAKQQAPLERLRLDDARTNGELFLSFIPNSDARNGQNDTWTLYHALLRDQPALAAIRGSGGVGQRLIVLILSIVAGSFFLILLLYIAWGMIVSSALFVVLLALAFVMIFAPAFGEGGRAVFFRWLQALGGALVMRVIFAIYLAVILLVTSIFFEIGSNLGGWLIEWIILAGIWSMAFFYRHRLLGIMTGGLYERHRHGQPNAGYAYSQLRNRMPGSSRSSRGGPVPAETNEIHHEYTGDTYYQHAHVYSNGERPTPRPVENVVDGEARELSESK